VKIRSQLIVLLGLPIVCQIASAAYLAHALEKEEALALQEMTAKRIVAICLEINGVMAQTVLAMGGLTLTGRGENETLEENLRSSTTKKIAELSELIGKDPHQKDLIAKFTVDSNRLIDNVADLARSYVPGKNQLFLSQFTSTDDYLDQLAMMIKGIQDDTSAMLKQYGPMARELKPKALHAKAELRKAVFTAIIANVLLVVILGAVLQFNTLERLKRLIANMHVFSDKKIIAGLDGNDELSEISRAFCEVATQRNNFEEASRSLRAMVSHDLRSPLTSMGLSVEMALGEAEIPPKTKRTMKMVLSEITRLRRLANTLLDLEKMEDGKLEVQGELHYCDELIETAIAASSSLSEQKQIKIATELGDEECFCDRDRTIQILVNLLSNAVKFSPTASTVKISARQVDNFVRIEIEDEGAGVAEADQAQLFGKFKQLDQAGETKAQGSGLGLYICKMLATAQHGRIGYSPGKEKGSCFWMELPVDESPTASV
jgi:signal transduction histidine kinase